jgi:hypothetical protein
VPDRAVRVGLIGPGRRRNGTGPFVARQLLGAGVAIVAVAARDRHGAIEGAARLQHDAAHRVAAMPDAAALLARDDLDGVAICSPAETHERYVTDALARRLHVFCEKPLVSGHADVVGRTGELADGFAAAGLVLHENTQWSYTLDDFEAVYGAIDRARVCDLAVELSPACGDPAEMLADAFPHVASLAVALGGHGETRDVECDWNRADAILAVRCAMLNAGGGPLRVSARFAQCADQPRPAAYAVDGRWLRRRIGSGYAIAFEADGRLWNVEDPLARSVRAFAASVRGAMHGGRPARAGASATAAAMTAGVRARVAALLPAPCPGHGSRVCT